MRASGRIVFGLLVCALADGWAQTRYIISTSAGSNPLGDNGPAAQGLLFYPVGVAVDAKGNVYIADSSNNRIRKISPAGIISTVACNGVAGYGGDGGPAVAAECFGPAGVAVDTAGNIFFSDQGNERVRKIGLDGTISLVAGNGSWGYGGDGGPATSAILYEPRGLAIDASGNVYFADFNNNRLRRVTPGGVISTVAGTGSCGFSGDYGPAAQAALCHPGAVAIDLQGRVVVADTGNSRIRRFSPNGVITTIAGVPNNNNPFSGDGGPATSATLSGPEGVAIDANGVIYLSDEGNQRIRVIATDGTISTVAGSIEGFGGDGGIAANALLNQPWGIAVDTQGNLYVADSGNHRIRMISNTHLITTLAGYGHRSGDNGPALSAVMSLPSFLTLDNNGNFYVSDGENQIIRKIDVTGTITTLAGTGMNGISGDGGPATAAQFSFPEGLASDAAGNLYVADGNNDIRIITPGGTIAKFAGDGASLGDGGPAKSARFSWLHGITIDTQGSMYIADTLDNRVRKITPDGNIQTLLGNGAAESSGDGGPASSGSTNLPWDVKVANDGTVYVSEYNGHRVRAVSPDGTVTTVGYISAYLTGLALDPAGNIIVAGGNQIWSLSREGVSTLIAGQIGWGFSGDGGPATQAQLYAPQGMISDAKGNIYFCDQYNNRIRKLTPDSVSQVVAVSGDQQSAALGTTLPLPLVVQVNGSSGLAFPGVTVSYAITSGGGRLSAKQTTTGFDGRAGVTLTLPDTMGTVTVTATVANLPPVQFTATGVNMPGAITVRSGNNQTGVIGSTLAQPLMVTVMGLDANPFAGATVMFAVTSGNATVNPTSVTTGNDGLAGTQVTLGNTPGPVTISATVAGLPPVMFSLTATIANGPQIFPGGVVSAGLSNPPVQILAPNAIVSIFGQSFAPAGTSRSVTAADLVNGTVPTNLAGVCVLFGTLRAPIFLVTPGQLNVQVPQVTVPGTPAVQVITGCDTPAEAASNTVTVGVQTASPEFFYAANNGTGANPVAAADGVTGAGIGDPARLGNGFALAYPGETVTLYVTGLGLSSPAFAAGQLPPGEAQVSGVTVSIDGAALDPSALQYAGVTPMNAGLYQLNLVLPASLASGDHAVSMSVSGRSSPAGAYISTGAIP